MKVTSWRQRQRTRAWLLVFVLCPSQAAAQGSKKEATSTLGIEGAAGFGRRSISTPGRATRSQSELALGSGVSWQYRVADFLWLGPRLGGHVWSQLDEAAWSVDATLSGTLRWFPERVLRPRVVFALGGAYQPLEAPRSFVIRHEIDSAPGLHSFIGLGVEGNAIRHRAWWFADLRGSLSTWFHHSHHMTDTATGELVTETDELTRFGVLLHGGLAWKL